MLVALLCISFLAFLALFHFSHPSLCQPETSGCFIHALLMTMIAAGMGRYDYQDDWKSTAIPSF
jgi:aminopeptidase-like protein